MLETGFLSGGNKGDGVNLLTGSANFSENDWTFPLVFGIQSWVIDSEKYNGFTVISSTKNWNGIYTKRNIRVKKDEKLTLSAFIKADSNSQAVFTCNRSIEGSASIAISKTVDIDTEWKRYFFTFEIKSDGAFYPVIEKQNGDEIKTYICGIKLERGSTPTPWTPAPEDVVVKSELEDKLKGFQNILFDKIDSGKTYALENGMYLLFLGQGGAQNKHGMYLIKKTGYPAGCAINEIASSNFAVTFSENNTSIVITTQINGSFNISLFKVMDFT